MAGADEALTDAAQSKEVDVWAWLCCVAWESWIVAENAEGGLEGAEKVLEVGCLGLEVGSDAGGC